MEEDEITIIDTKWTTDHEKILIDWADKAMCYRWLHASCNRYFYSLNIWFTIPVIALSTLTGTANFAHESFPENIKSYAPLGIGALNIIAGFITTVQQFLKVNELNEGHRVASISWGKFYRNIKIELAKNPSDRQGVTLFLKKCKEDYDLLMEVSPMIRQKSIRDFNNKFKASETDFYRPEICDSLISTKIGTFVREEPSNNEEQLIYDLIRKRKETMKKEEIIEKFISDFKQEHKRTPETCEIIENLNEQISQPMIENYLSKINRPTNIKLIK